MITITTFGYLHGPAPQADVTLDLRRHFRDPHVDPALRQMTARDTRVCNAVLATPGIIPLVFAASATARAYLEGPGADGVAIAVGCAGGAVAAAVVAEVLANDLESLGITVEVEHRDLDKAVVDR
jgi:RNase adaptor protein for sRNA GlmZ degradation